ncbi:hypothetical protein LTR36_010422 [Oleoguttula mirabilis]|uniref:Uncharacterized protein n=1 Tax=Oleoguttula mirabilis TaxID=1507867 RepID=A0AAV9J4K7_9PEZI|nr:hypothetical protein LTR36_010422 [Oleoguttula mirabilis]
MKFAKELEDNAVAEWKGKYLDYKAGKKKLKAVSKAIRNVEPPTDTTYKKPAPAPKPRSPFASLRDAPVYSFLQREQQRPAELSPPPDSRSSGTPLVLGRSSSEAPTPTPRLSQSGDNATDATPRARAINERSPLQGGGGGGRKDGPRMTRYGSIIGSPPDSDGGVLGRLNKTPTLQLPEPAMRESADTERDRPISPGTATDASVPRAPLTQLAHRGNAYEVTKPTDTPSSQFDPPSNQRYKSLFAPRRANSSPAEPGRPFARRVFSIATPGAGLERSSNTDVALEAYREVDFRQAEFFLFLDKQLEKIETFHKSKEQEALERLKVLREQLHIMRDQRGEEVMAAEQRRGSETLPPQNRGGAQPNGHLATQNGTTEACQQRRTAHPFSAVEATREALDRVRTGRLGKTSKAMGQLGTPPTPGQQPQQHQDYTRRATTTNDPPYRTAKRKLKIALAEFHRGLELLKSYALLNRTAFRKINKKFDKTVHPAAAVGSVDGSAAGGSSASGKDYMAEKVNTAHFVESATPDELLLQVEDLYARYFERGNRKIAVGKLRAKGAGAGSYYGAVVRTGVLVGGGLVLGLQGIVYGSLKLDTTIGHANRPLRTSYLLQIYAGYFLMLLLVWLFCLDAAVFARFRVNYQFIFEFDTRHVLDWKQLCELPAWFTFLLGVTMWLNFCVVAGGDAMYIYWPVVLVGLSVTLFFCPPPLFYPRSRGWFLTSNFRLLLAGAYPVEFRDFFLGDMFCSQTYALGNTELFFCLYARHWNDPPQCNSGNSRLLGFFSTLPGIWRLLQCVRRYYDTGLWTHGANGVKYTCTILQYMSLSLWRFNKSSYGLEAFFIVCASMNSLYCIFWDLYYDWSMPMNPFSKPPLLRNTLAYRRHIWWYYVAIALDPILRFNWIFYVIYAQDLQHSSIISFLVSLSEVIRRGMWVLFRVENEHATNVGRYRAQRDPALPYEVMMPDGQADDARDSDHHAAPEQALDGTPAATAPAGARASARDVEQGGVSPSGASSLRQRHQSVAADSPVYRALRRAGTTMLNAHAQDYERRKPNKEDEKSARDEDTDEDDDDDD